MHAEQESASSAFAPFLTYEPFFGLKEKPFSLSSDPRFLYKSAGHEVAFDQLNSGIRRREGLIVLSGEIGMGKTTLCRAVISQLDRKTFATFVPDPFVTREDLLKMLLVGFGVVSVADLNSGRLRGASRQDLSYPLYEFLDSLVPLQAFAVLVIDEAQNLSLGVMEEIRILAELEKREKLLQVVLVGQPELRDNLKLPQMRQVDQRVTVRCELAPLGARDVSAYVRHRLSVAAEQPGCIDFTEGALEAVLAASGGVPRLINQVCDRALNRAFDMRAKTITRDTVTAAALDVGITERATPVAYAPADHPPLPFDVDAAVDPAVTETAPTPRVAVAAVTETTPAPRVAVAAVTETAPTPRVAVPAVTQTTPAPRVAVPDTTMAPAVAAAVPTQPAAPHEPRPTQPLAAAPHTPPTQFVLLGDAAGGSPAEALDEFAREPEPGAAADYPQPARIEPARSGLLSLLAKAIGVATAALGIAVGAGVLDVRGTIDALVPTMTPALPARPERRRDVAPNAFAPPDALVAALTDARAHEPDTYTVLVGAYRDRALVERLAGELLADGYRARWAEVQTGSPEKASQQVFVDGYGTLESAMSAVVRLRRRPGTPGARLVRPPGAGRQAVERR